MDELELTRKLEKLKTKVRQKILERDELKRQLNSITSNRSRNVQHSVYGVECEKLRKSTILNWNEVERQERLHRIVSKGLQAKINIYEDQLEFWRNK